ncbi:MAG: AAA family ATPase, partial [Neisseriaceae bacterium]|nr:AAA family ATPase [Neisseriaceae bacterium]
MNNTDLFQTEPTAPLAERMRPKTIDDIVGQQHLVGKNRPLRLAIDSGKPHSMILWGPPGVGKTTLARIFADSFAAQFLPISAVFSGVKDIREAVEKAQMALARNQQTILFVDEIHRFNKSQQDAFLPYVESGLFSFIGATTENPSFEVNSALLSRSRVYTLNALNTNDLLILLNRVFVLPEYADLQMNDQTRQKLCELADGDARRLLNMAEQLFTAAKTQQIQVLDDDFLSSMLDRQVRRFDKGGENFYDQISALHKSVRGSHPNAALYWLCR